MLASSDTGAASGPKHRTTTARASASRSLATDWALDIPPGTSDEPHLGSDGLRRSLQVGEHLEPRIGHRHDGDRRLPAVGAGVRQRREQRRLAGEGRADESDVLHGSFTVTVG